jgi:adenylate cyclase
MKKIIILCLLCFAFHSTYCQNSELDSLKLALKLVKNDTSKCTILSNLIESVSIEEIPQFNTQLLQITENKLKTKNLKRNEYNFFTKYYAIALNNEGYLESNKNNYTKAIEYYERGIKLSEKIDDKKGIALAFNNIGSIYQEQGDVVKGLKYYEKSLKIKEEIKDKNGIASSISNIGHIYQDNGDIIKALSCYEKCLKIDEELGEKKNIAVSLNSIAFIYKEQGNLSKAEEYYTKSLKIREELGDKKGASNVLNNFGVLFEKQKEYVKALEYYEKCLKMQEEIDDKKGKVNSLNNIGNVYYDLNETTKSLLYLNKSLELNKEVDNKKLNTIILNNIGRIYLKEKNYSKALEYSLKSLQIAKELGFPTIIRNAALQLNLIYKATGNDKLALQNYELFIQMRDSVNNIETQKATIKQQTKYEYEKQKAVEDEKHSAELNAQNEKALAAKKRQYLIIGAVSLVLLLVAIFSMLLYKRFKLTQKQKQIISIEKHRSEELLLNILPHEIAEELKEKGEAEAKHFDAVSILFTDFKGFTQLSETLTPKELIAELNHCFIAFDNIIVANGLEKIKTIGDAYMAASGLPTQDAQHAHKLVKAAIDIRDFMQDYKQQRIQAGKKYFELRIGIHSGEAVAGIVGIKKFAYDVWGDTVNTASRMESSGEVGKVNISEATFNLVKEDYNCEPRGFIEAKGKGKMNMYFAEYNA